MKKSTHPQVSKGAVEEKRPFYSLLESPRGHGQTYMLTECYTFLHVFFGGFRGRRGVSEERNDQRRRPIS